MTRSLLLIDDDPDIRNALALVLGDLEFQVRTACDGREALKLLPEIEAPGLILLDLCMPVMDDEEFRARQLAIPSLSRTPVIVMSADPNLDDKAQALKVEAALPKPVDVDVLVAVQYGGPAR